MIHPTYELTLFDELELVKYQLIKTKTSLDNYNGYNSRMMAQHTMDYLDNLYNKKFKNYLNTHYMQCYQYAGYGTVITEDTYLINKFNTVLSAYDIIKPWNKLDYLGVHLRNHWPKYLLGRWLRKRPLSLKDFNDIPAYRSYMNFDQYYCVDIPDVQIILKKLLHLLRKHINDIVEQTIKLYRHDDIRHMINHRPIELSPKILNL